MRPRLSFILGGVQKAGTSAMAAYLAQHPDLRLPAIKEAHVFDAPDFPAGSAIEAVDSRFRTHFDESDWACSGLSLGDATPITVFHPEFIDRVSAYNPDMRWIVMLRDPIDRAISQWHMEHRRGAETWPMWAAFLLEPFRLAAHHENWSEDSPMRRYSYLRRGRYSFQLDKLRQRFPPSQVLLVHSQALQGRPDAVMRRVFDFLGVPNVDEVAASPLRVFEGHYDPPGSAHIIRHVAKWRLGADADFPGHVHSRFCDLEFVQ
jgi:hypothetical protein